MKKLLIVFLAITGLASESFADSKNEARANKRIIELRVDPYAGNMFGPRGFIRADIITFTRTVKLPNTISKKNNVVTKGKDGCRLTVGRDRLGMVDRNSAYDKGHRYGVMEVGTDRKTNEMFINAANIYNGPLFLSIRCSGLTIHDSLSDVEKAFGGAIKF